MKKITSITEYPFINRLLCDVMEDKVSEWVKTEDTEIMEKDFLNRYEGDNLEIADDLNDVATTYLNEGFLNGYIIATKMLKGELM